MEGFLLVLYRITCVIWVFPSSAHLSRLAWTFCLGSMRRYRLVITIVSQNPTTFQNVDTMYRMYEWLSYVLFVR